ncbi:MAG: ABC transporter permease [Betaproteobacteria bacterium]|nr:ABC transporter permease [Betaproteobacteria bacterium]
MTFAHRLAAAGRDIRDGIAQVHVWGLLGWQDMRQRYRRSVIGPFWLTLSTAIMLATMGLLYGRLFGQDLRHYLPYLAVGLIVWGTLLAIVNESCQVFIGASAVIKQIRLPLTTHVCRVIWRNALLLAHNAVILVPLALWAEHGPTLALFSVPLGFAVLLLNGLWIGLFLGVLCARFRDVPPIVANLMQIAFFITPIIFRPEVLGNRAWIAAWNPLYHLIEVVRAPIVEGRLPLGSWAGLAAFTLGGALVTLLLFARTRARVPYWL